MYNKTILPQTGMVGLGLFGLSAQNSIITGFCFIIVGIILIKLIKFKLKDKKN
jgi:hypothetical protein